MTGYSFTLDCSRRQCLKVYTPPSLWHYGYRQLITGNRIVMPSSYQIRTEQDALLSSIWKWRYNKAKTYGLHMMTVMSNSEVLRIGLKMPNTILDLEKCGPLSAMVRKYENEIVALVRESNKLDMSKASTMTNKDKDIHDTSDANTTDDEEAELATLYSPHRQRGRPEACKLHLAIVVRTRMYTSAGFCSEL